MISGSHTELSDRIRMGTQLWVTLVPTHLPLLYAASIVEPYLQKGPGHSQYHLLCRVENVWGPFFREKSS